MAMFFIVFIIILSVRSVDVGADSKNYYKMYREIGVLPWNKLFGYRVPLEYGNLVLQKLLNVLFGDSLFVFLFATSVIAVVPIWIFYSRRSEAPLLAIALFISVAPFSMYFSGIRQIIAMGLGVVAWHFTKKKNVILFILTVIFAVLFHRSAIVLVFMFPLYYLKIKRVWLAVIIPVILVAFVFNKQIITLIYNLTGLYAENELALADTNAYGMLIILAMLTAFSFIVPNEKLMDKDAIALRNLLVFSLIIQCFAPIHGLVMRFNYYYLIFVPITITQVLKFIDAKFAKLKTVFMWVMGVAFVGLFFYRAYFGGDQLKIFPYIPFWEVSQ